jgi:uncharacterized protein DUF3618
MGESTSQIERDIAAERNDLGRNLQLLEHKARSLTDWRMHFRKHPFALMAVALGGGALLGVLTNRLGGPEASEFEEDDYLEPESARYSRPSAFAASAAQARRQFGDTWDHIAEALLAVASAKAIQFVADKVPGFREEFAARHPEHRGGYSPGRGV